MISTIFCAFFALLGFGQVYESLIRPNDVNAIKIVMTVIFFAISFVCYKDSVRVKKMKELSKINTKKLEEINRSRISETREKISKIENDFGFKSIGAKNVGGSGYTLSQGQQINFGINKSSIIIIKINDLMDVIDIPFEEVTEIEISGPGTVVTNAGVSGGGFGLDGFIKGAVAAAVINAATTSKTTNTFMRLMTATGEIYIHTSEIEPDSLKIKLSPVFVHLKNKSNQQIKIPSSSIAEEIERLQKLLKDGILSQEEFDAAKKKSLYQ